VQFDGATSAPKTPESVLDQLGHHDGDEAGTRSPRSLGTRRQTTAALQRFRTPLRRRRFLLGDQVIEPKVDFNSEGLAGRRRHGGSTGTITKARSRRRRPRRA
jgi:hypothetical protein